MVRTEIFNIVPSKNETVLDFITYLTLRGKTFSVYPQWISSAMQQICVVVVVDDRAEEEDVAHEAQMFREKYVPTNEELNEELADLSLDEVVRLATHNWSDTGPIRDWCAKQIRETM